MAKVKQYSGGLINCKAYQPELVDSQSARARILNTLKDNAAYARRQFEGTVQTWNEPPDFTTEIRYKGGDAIYRVEPVGPNAKKWFWLNSGTSVRRVKLSKDWRSKTSPGSLTSGPGAGRVEAINQNFAFPGIEARRWLPLIKQRSAPRLGRMMKRTMRDIAARKR